MAAPYAASDPATRRYFDGLVRRAQAPIFYADAGPAKGKAIYAAQPMTRATRIWSETPIVAMQHEANKRAGVTCCQGCFLPLIDDYRREWKDMATRWNAHVGKATRNISGKRAHNFAPVEESALDEALSRLQVSAKSCGLAGVTTRCVCGEPYCSRECQARAFHETHALLCPRSDPCSAMGEFLQHMQHTNDIFLLVAKVIARVLSRYLVLRDAVKARAPIDMFFKKPWWEVVLEDPDGEREFIVEKSFNGDTVSDDSGENDDTPRYEGDGDIIMIPQAPQLITHTSKTGLEPQINGLSNVLPLEKQHTDSNGNAGWNGVVKATTPGSVGSQGSHYLQEVLAFTHQLLLDALESNLVRLERENQLCGVTVEEIWRACGSVLSFEFFAAQIGMFEMNNISMEIDHPFHALVDFFDPEMPADIPHPTLSAEDQEIVGRVRAVLEWEEAQRLEKRRQIPSECCEDDLSGFPGVEGTALFPIMCTMNHSCDPNCTVLYTRDGEGHVVAIREIKEGEELCICYIDIDMELTAREQNLHEYKFVCHCSRCVREREQVEQR